MNKRRASASGTSGRITQRTDGIYARAQEKAKTMQFAIRSGRPSKGKMPKKLLSSEDEGRDEVLAHGKSTGGGIKKPTNFGPGERTDNRYGLPVTDVELAVIWIPSRGEWTRTITLKDIFRQLKEQKVKVLIDSDDGSCLTMVAGETSDVDINMK